MTRTASLPPSKISIYSRSPYRPNPQPDCDVAGLGSRRSRLAMSGARAPRSLLLSRYLPSCLETGRKSSALRAHPIARLHAARPRRLRRIYAVSPPGWRFPVMTVHCGRFHGPTSIPSRFFRRKARCPIRFSIGERLAGVSGAHLVVEMRASACTATRQRPSPTRAAIRYG